MPIIKSLQRLSTTQALKILEDQYGIVVSIPTLIKWVRENELGVKLGGQWWINAEKLGIYIEKGTTEDDSTQA